jgi:hypothetical protein
MSKHRIKALQAIANDAASTDNEKAIAKRLLKRMGAEDTPPATAQRIIKFGSAQEGVLLSYISVSLGCTPYKVRRGTRGRWRNEYNVEGPQDFLDLCEALFDRHRVALKAHMDGALHGYCHGAFPQPPKEDTEDAPKKEYSEDFLNAYFSGKSTGARNRNKDSRLLTDKGGSR